MYDEKVLDYRTKYEDAHQQLRELENEMFNLNESFNAINDEKDKKIKDLYSA